MRSLFAKIIKKAKEASLKSILETLYKILLIISLVIALVEKI